MAGPPFPPADRANAYKQEQPPTVELDDEIDRNRNLVINAFKAPAIVAVALVVIVLIAAAFVSWFLVPVVLILVGGAAFYLVRLVKGAEQAALTAVGAVEIDEASHPRIHNVAEGLSAVTGVAVPRLHVVDRPDVNVFAVGLDPRRSSLVITSGMVEQFEPIELEGIFAQQLVHVRNLDILPATIAVVFPPLRTKLDPERELRADRAAIAITRYPPGLLAALEKVRTAPTTAPAAASTAHLWTSPPDHAADATASDLLDLRIDVLHET